MPDENKARLVSLLEARGILIEDESTARSTSAPAPACDQSLDRDGNVLPCSPSPRRWRGATRG